jgi:hypothetical protein
VKYWKEYRLENWFVLWWSRYRHGHKGTDDGPQVFLILEAILEHRAFKPIQNFFLLSCPYKACVIHHLSCETKKCLNNWWVHSVAICHQSNINIYFLLATSSLRVYIILTSSRHVSAAQSHPQVNMMQYINTSESLPRLLRIKHW